MLDRADEVWKVSISFIDVGTTLEPFMINVELETQEEYNKMRFNVKLTFHGKCYSADIIQQVKRM